MAYLASYGRNKEISKLVILKMAGQTVQKIIIVEILKIIEIQIICIFISYDGMPVV